jgi:hypothetical protein
MRSRPRNVPISADIIIIIITRWLPVQPANLLPPFPQDKSHAHFSLLRSFYRIPLNPQPCETFRNFQTGLRWCVAHSPRRRTAPCLYKKKAIPVTGRGGLQACEMLRIPHCLDNRLTDGGKVVSPAHQPRSTPQKRFFCFWYPFLLEAE